MMKLQLTVPDMACGACVSAITQAIVKVDATARVEADAKTKLVYVETQADEKAVKEAIATAGYTVA
jgi:copper chaperone